MFSASLSSEKLRLNTIFRPAVIVGAAFLLSLAPPTFAGIQAVSFGPPINLGGGGGFGDLRLVDLNRDGKLDIVNGSNSNQLLVHLGNGDGTYLAPATYSTGSAIKGVAVGDLNSDGWADVAAALDGGTVRIFLGTGTGSLVDSGGYAVGSFPSVPGR